MYICCLAWCNALTLICLRKKPTSGYVAVRVLVPIINHFYGLTEAIDYIGVILLVNLSAARVFPKQECIIKPLSWQGALLNTSMFCFDQKYTVTSNFVIEMRNHILIQLRKLP